MNTNPLQSRPANKRKAGANENTFITNRIQNKVPAEVISALERRLGYYTDMRDIFYCIQIDLNHWIGVAGDGANASYENFSLQPDKFECSDCGYGETAIALRDILAKHAH